MVDGKTDEEKMSMKKLNTLTTDFRPFFVSMKKTVDVITNTIDEDDHIKAMVDLKYLKMIKEKDDEIMKLKSQLHELQSHQNDDVNNNENNNENENEMMEEIDDDEMKMIIDNL